MKIFLIGFMGSGKTHWGRQLGTKLQIPFFDLDEKVVEYEGRAINEIFANKGEEYFRKKEKETLYLITESHKDFVMACGGGTPCFFNNIDYLKKNGMVIWLNSSADSLHKRLAGEKDKRPLIAAVPDEELRDFIQKRYSSRKIYYQQANVIINEENITLDHIINRIFHS
jgi:shikimate kinase